MICSICPRKCNVDRSKKLGFCQSPDNFRVARASLHYWEEPCISGKQGSGAVFFSGCNLKCVFCQNNEISSQNKGVEITEEKLIEIFESLIKQGANNINLVNPTHYALQIANVLKKWKSPVPIVYNSSGYEEVETLKELDGLIDIYLPDLKYYDDWYSIKYSKAPNYFNIAIDAIEEMYRQVGNVVYDKNGIMKKGIIVRHLMLPGRGDDSKKIIEYLHLTYGNNIFISIMNQYTPLKQVKEIDELNKKVSDEEYSKLINYACDIGVENAFIQEGDTCSESFIPEFDLTGVK